MPNTRAAKDAMRNSRRRNVINTRTKFKFKEAVKKVTEAISTGDAKAAEEALPKAMATLDKAAKKNVIPKLRASRKKSRLAKAIAKLTE